MCKCVCATNCNRTMNMKKWECEQEWWKCVWQLLCSWQKFFCDEKMRIQVFVLYIALVNFPNCYFFFFGPFAFISQFIVVTNCDKNYQRQSSTTASLPKGVTNYYYSKSSSLNPLRHLAYHQMLNLNASLVNVSVNHVSGLFRHWVILKNFQLIR